MNAATKFVFGTDFREGSRRAAGEAEMTAARAAAFAEGEASGRRQAEMQGQRAVSQLIGAVEALRAETEHRLGLLEGDAAGLAVALAKAIAGAALTERPLARLEQAVRECIGHARHAPHLVVRVADDAVETVETLVQRQIRETGFAGRLVVMGEPDIAAGDGRIEWADGGFTIEAGRTAEMVERAVAQVFGRSDIFGRSDMFTHDAATTVQEDIIG